MQVMTQQFARNLRNQVVCLSSDPKGTEYVEWKAAGDPAGDDVQIVPDAVRATAAYMRLLQKRIVVEISAEEAMDAVLRQNENFTERTTSVSDQITATIEHTENKDILSLSCVGPDARNEGQCGIQIPVTQATKDDAPPLCNQHIGLIGQYVPSDEENGRVWKRVVMTRRETAQ